MFNKDKPRKIKRNFCTTWTGNYRYRTLTLAQPFNTVGTYLTIYICSSCMFFRLFLERHERELFELRSQFSSMSVMDERTELVVSFLENLWERLAADSMFAATNEEQREEARVAVERAIFSQVPQVLQSNHKNTYIVPCNSAFLKIFHFFCWSPLFWYD